MKPLISVVMPVYNSKRYLDKAVRSILDQTFRDFEFVIVDDGSTDGSSDMLQGYADQHPDIIRLHRQENQGAYAAYNKCIELAEGQYILGCNSDDYYVEDSLEILSSYVLRYDVDVVFVNTATHIADLDQNIIKRDHQTAPIDKEFVILDQMEVRQFWFVISRYGLLNNNINLYKADIMKRYPFRTDWYGADYMLNIDIANDITSVACHPKPLYQNFLYHDNYDESRNISVGKYYDYEHDMFNTFYLQYKKLLSSWDVLDDTKQGNLATARLYKLNEELEHVFAWNNTMPYTDNLASLVSYFDEVVIEAAAILGKRDEVENKILGACWKQLTDAKEKGIRAKNRQKEHGVARLIDAALSMSQKSARDRVQMMLGALYDESNPNRLGLMLYENFCVQNPKVSDPVMLQYLKAEVRARECILIGHQEQAAELIDELFALPVSDPEKYLLLGHNHLLSGLAEEALSAIAAGLETFPESARLRNAAQQFRAKVEQG